MNHGQRRRAIRDRRENPPQTLLDPEGEGIYLLDDLWEKPRVWPNVLMRAAWIFFNDMRRWKDIDLQIAYMDPAPGRDEWVPGNIGRWPRGWRLNLPVRWRPRCYCYCTPKADSQ